MYLISHYVLHQLFEIFVIAIEKNCFTFVNKYIIAKLCSFPKNQF